MSAAKPAPEALGFGISYAEAGLGSAARRKQARPKDRLAGGGNKIRIPRSRAPLFLSEPIHPDAAYRRVGALPLPTWPETRIGVWPARFCHPSGRFVVMANATRL